MTFANKQSSIAARAAEVGHRLARGESQGSIARSLGVSQATVSRVVSELREDWRREALSDFAGVQYTLMEQVRAVVRAAWATFDNSGQVDTSALAIVLRAIETQARILGVPDAAIDEGHRHLQAASVMLVQAITEEVRDPVMLHRIIGRLEAMRSGVPPEESNFFEPTTDAEICGESGDLREGKLLSHDNEKAG